MLVGQDLAYTNGQAYARGTPYETSRVRVENGELLLDWSDTLKATHERANSTMRTREPLDEGSIAQKGIVAIQHQRAIVIAIAQAGKRIGQNRVGKRACQPREHIR